MGNKERVEESAPLCTKRKQSVREARRRRAWWCLINDCEKKALDEIEATRIRVAIDGNKPSYFGIETVAKYDLQQGVIHDAPSWLRSGPEFSVIAYAAVRGRSGIVESLLKKGIEPLWDPARFWALSEVEVRKEIEPKLKGLQPSAAAPILCLAARSLEFGVRKKYCWKWIITTHTGRSNWHGCGCEFDGIQFWNTLLDDITAEYCDDQNAMQCPRCGDQGMPRPMSLKWIAHRSRKSRIPKVVRNAREEGKVRPSVWFDAVQRMPADAIRELSSLCDVNARDECGATAAHYAAIRGDIDLLHLEQDAFLGAANLDLVCGPRGTPERFALSPNQIREQRRHLYAGTAFQKTYDAVSGTSLPPSCFLSDALPSLLLADLDTLYRAAEPKVSEGRSSDDAVERRHFLDPGGILEGYISRALDTRVCLSPKAKFLYYRYAGAELPSHIDLCKSTKWLGPRHRTSTSHTWIIYLTTADETHDDAGATVLLSDLQPEATALYTVYPKRGRLFVFPHRHPHAAKPTCGGQPKLVARGELFFWDRHRDE